MTDHITVCVITYCRQRMLKRLLHCLSMQDTGGIAFSVVVIDNDPAGSAQETVESLAGELGLDIAYGLGLRYTIPSARNYALKLARGNYIGIIDDDEFPPANWLRTLYDAVRVFDVDGALGPVHPYFEAEPPMWLLQSKLCERPVLRTGTLLQWNQTRTGNVLLKRDVFERHQQFFDESFTTGGSDREFFRRVMSRGFRFVAVSEAPVYEIVPPQRWTRRYWIRRSLVNGFNSHGNAGCDEQGLLRAVAIGKFGLVSLVYTILIPFCVCAGNPVLMKCLVRWGHHFSHLCALAGIELVRKRDF